MYGGSEKIYEDRTATSTMKVIERPYPRKAYQTIGEKRSVAGLYTIWKKVALVAYVPDQGLRVCKLQNHELSS